MSGYSTTPNYGLRKPVVGADNDLWGGDLNLNADTIDTQIKARADAIAGIQVTYLPLAGGTMSGPLTIAGGAVNQAGDSRYGFDYYWNDPVNGGVGGGIRVSDGAFVWGPGVFKTLQVLTSVSIPDGTANFSTLSVTGTTNLGAVNAGSLTLSGALTPSQVTVGGQIWAATTGPIAQFVSYSWSDSAGNLGPYISTTGVLTAGDARINTNLTLGYTPTQATHAVSKGYVDTSFIGPAGGTVSGPLLLTAAISVDQQAATKAYVDSASASGGAGGLAGLRSQKDFPYPPLRDPKRDYGAYADGVTDDSVAINNCVTAALAAGERAIAINDTYACPNLSANIAMLLLIGTGRLVNANVQMFVIPPWAPAAPSRLPNSTLSLNSHCPKFAAKLRAQVPADPAAVVVITGESNFAPNTNPTVLGGNWARIQLAIQQANSNKKINFFNRAVGGQRWSNLDSTPSFTEDPTVSWYTDGARAWLLYIQDLNPDLVIIGLGGNDGLAFRLQYMISVLNKMAAWANPPEVILATSNPYAQQYLSGTMIQTWEGQQGTMNMERSWAASKGLGLIDTDRAITIHCKGFDPDDIPLQRDFVVTGNNQTTVGRKMITTPFTWPTRVWGWSALFYVQAGGWAQLGNEIQFELGTSFQGAPNAGNILRIGRNTSTGNIYYEVDTSLVSLGATQDSIHVPHTDAAGWIDIHGGDMSFMVSVVGSRLAIQSMTGGTSGNGFDQWTFNKIMHVPRYNQPWQPKITCTAGAVSNYLFFEKDAYGYAFAASAIPDQRAFYMPSMTEHEAYGGNTVTTDIWGGSGVGHDSSLKGLWAHQCALNSCQWGA